jgi:hypothetical protein
MSYSITESIAMRGCGRTWKISHARSMRLAKSEELELPGESTVEAMGERSRWCPGVRREEPAVKGFRRLP